MAYESDKAGRGWRPKPFQGEGFTGAAMQGTAGLVSRVLEDMRRRGLIYFDGATRGEPTGMLGAGGQRLIQDEMDRMRREGNNPYEY
jgi:hypothetical protein